MSDFTKEEKKVAVNVPLVTQTGIDRYENGFATRIFDSTDSMQTVYDWALKVNKTIKLHEIKFGWLHNE